MNIFTKPGGMEYQKEGEERQSYCVSQQLPVTCQHESEFGWWQSIVVMGILTEAQ